MMNPTKSKTVFEEREELRVQLLSTQDMLVAEQRHTRRLGAQLTAVEELLRGLTAELQATRKVVETAVAANIANNAITRIGDAVPFSERSPAYYDAVYKLKHAERLAAGALASAVREYRTLAEPLSQSKEAAHA